MDVTIENASLRWYECRCGAIVVYSACPGEEIECASCQAKRFAKRTDRDVAELAADRPYAADAAIAAELSRKR